MKKNSLILTASLFAALLVSLVGLNSWMKNGAGNDSAAESGVPAPARDDTPGSAEAPEATPAGETSRETAGRQNVDGNASASSSAGSHAGYVDNLPEFDRVEHDGILFQDVTAPDERGRFQRMSVVEVDFHYPHLRYTEHFEIDPEGGEPALLGSHAMVADHVMARIDPALTNAEVESLFPGENIKVRRRMEEQGLFLLEFPLERIDAVEAAIERISAEQGYVEYAEPDHIVTPAQVDPPSDPFFDELWGLHNTGQPGFFLDSITDPLFGDFFFFQFGDGRPGADIDALRGWEIRTDASNIVVAVMDTGINFNHEDLKGNIWRNPREKEDGRDTSGSGFIDDIHGVDITTGGPPMDDQGHGTHVSGTIGALGDNGIGVSGVAWDVQLMGVRFLTLIGGTQSDAILSYDYARLNGADVINGSFGGFFYSRAEKEAIERLRDAGIILVAAAGNDGKNIDIFEHFYPARYDLDNIVRVGASDRRDQPAVFSNFGPESVDIFAPGVDILSTSVLFEVDPDFGFIIPIQDNSFYQFLDGTSMAAPHVSGIMALIAAEYPGEDYRTLINRLLAGARIEEEFFGDVVRESRFANLFNPLSQGDAPILFTGLQDVDFTEGDTVTLEVDAAARPAAYFTWFRDGELVTDAAGEPLSGSSITLENMSEDDAGRYEVVVSSVPNPGPDDETVTSSARVRFNPGDPRLGVAAGAPELALTSSGDRPWEVAEGGGAVRSFADLGNGETSRMIANVHGPATISFEWKVSSERIHDKLHFRGNGESLRAISGETGWEPITVELSEARPYQLAWSYEKDLTGTAGEDAGWVRNISFAPAFPHIVSQPRDVEVLEGATARIRLSATGDPDPQFRWYRNGERVDGAVFGTLTINGAEEGDAGEYRAEAWNTHGVAESVRVQLSVVSEANLPVVVKQPEGAVVMEGDVVVLETAYEGTSPIQVQWSKAGAGPIPGATGDRLVLTGIEESDAGSYFATISNQAGSVTTLSAEVTVINGEDTFEALLHSLAGAESGGSEPNVPAALYHYATGSDRSPEAAVRSPGLIRAAAADGTGTVERTLDGEKYFGLEFERRRDAVGVSFHLEASDDLERWEEVPAVLEVIDVLDEETERVLLREEEHAPAAGVRFLRLRIRHSGN